MSAQTADETVEAEHQLDGVEGARGRGAAKVFRTSEIKMTACSQDKEETVSACYHKSSSYIYAPISDDTYQQYN